MRSPVNLAILRGVQPREPFDPFPHSSMIRICALASILLLTTPAIAQQAPGGGPPAGGPAAAPAPAPTPTIPAAGDPVKGREKTQLCEGCHGIVGWRTAYPEVYHVPKIGGQHEAYLISALKQYRSGDRSHPSMRAIAGSLTDEDMANLAAYYSRAHVQVSRK
jgi:cytochrome c553